MVAADAPVITVQGLCEKPPNSNATPADCSTVITRADFEKLINAVQPNMPAANKKAFATRYVTLLVLAEKAHEMGLDKNPDFDEQMYIARTQLLARQAAEKMQRDAANVPESDINAYDQQSHANNTTISSRRISLPQQNTLGAPPGHPKKPMAQTNRKAS